MVLASKNRRVVSPEASGLMVIAASVFGGERLRARVQCELKLARQAYAARNLSGLELLVQSLSQYPYREARQASLFYSGMIAKWRKETAKASIIFESLLDCSTLQIRSLALAAYAVIRLEQGHQSEAVSLYFRLAKTGSSAVDQFTAQIQMSAIRSIEGDHQGALTQLENLYPLVRVAALEQPHLYPLYHNELAVELLEVGRVEEAAHASLIALGSPFAPAYPEWGDTYNGITLKPRRASRSFVALNGWHDEEKLIEPNGNLIPLPAMEQEKSTNNTKTGNGRVLVFKPKAEDQTKLDNEETQIESKPLECEPEGDTEYTINYSPVRTLTLRFVGKSGQERLKLEIRHDPDGAVADIWARDKDGNSHSFFSACFLD